MAHTWNEFPPVGSEVQIFQNAKIVRRSTNLRGLIKHAGQVGVHAATLFSSKPNSIYGEGLVIAIRHLLVVYLNNPAQYPAIAGAGDHGGLSAGKWEQVKCA